MTEKTNIAIGVLEIVLGFTTIDKESRWVKPIDEILSTKNLNEYYGYTLCKLIEKTQLTIFFYKLDINEDEQYCYQTPEEYIYSSEGFGAVFRTMHDMGFTSYHSRPAYGDFWSWEFNHDDGYHSKMEDVDFYSACYKSAIMAMHEKHRLGVKNGKS